MKQIVFAYWLAAFFFGNAPAVVRVDDMDANTRELTSAATAASKQS